MLYQSCLFDVSPYLATFVQCQSCLPNVSPYDVHAHIRLTVRVICHDLTEMEKRGVNYIAPGNLPRRHIVLYIPLVRIFNRWKEQSTFKFFTLEITERHVYSI